MKVRLILDLWDGERLWFPNYGTTELEFPDDGGIALANAIARFSALFAQEPRIADTTKWPDLEVTIPPPVRQSEMRPGMKFIIKSVVRTD